MPLFYLELEAGQLENVAKLQTAGVKRWEFSVRCGHCNADAPKHVQCEAGVMTAIPGSRGEAHVVMKCKQCERTSSIELVETARKGVKLAELSAVEAWTRVAAFECRGLEPLELELGRCGPFAVTTSGGQEMEARFDEGDWCDYSEQDDASVGVYQLRARFVRG